MQPILLSPIISFVLSPLIFVYLNYENNVRILLYKRPYYTALYGFVFSLLALFMSYLIIDLGMFTSTLPEIKNYPWLIAIIVGLFTKHIFSLISVEIKNKEYGIKAIPRIIEHTVIKRMNDTINGYYESRVNSVVTVVKRKKIHNIIPIIEEILPIQIKGAERKKYVGEFRILKTDYLKLMYLSITFGETVLKSFERRLNEK